MATQEFQDGGAGKVTQLCQKIVHVNLRWSITGKVTVLRRFIRLIWERILACSVRLRTPRYKRLSTPSPRRNSFSCSSDTELREEADHETTTSRRGYESDSDLVSLKISILGDCQIGKTTFVIKYVGDEEENRSLQMKGLNLMDKNLRVKGARIVFKIWDVGGDINSFDQVPLACKDAVAILFMFDLTSRCTLNSITEWYTQARKWNQTAIPVLVGTKFDDFSLLPRDIQRTIINQARVYARAMKATLFFSSAKHNINVNKIFKFIMAKLFDLPWTPKRNLSIGEPIIDF